MITSLYYSCPYKIDLDYLSHKLDTNTKYLDCVGEFDQNLNKVVFKNTQTEQDNKSYMFYRVTFEKAKLAIVNLDNIAKFPFNTMTPYNWFDTWKTQSVYMAIVKAIMNNSKQECPYKGVYFINNCTHFDDIFNLSQIETGITAEVLYQINEQYPDQKQDFMVYHNCTTCNHIARYFEEGEYPVTTSFNYTKLNKTTCTECASSCHEIADVNIVFD